MKRAHTVARHLLLTHRRHTVLSSILILIAFVLLANFGYIFVTNPNPLLSRSGLPVQGGSVFMHLPFAAGNSIEGNDGITKQALGVQTAHQLLSGKLPLWNYYEGVGAPLLGETQSAALFPFTLLLLLPNGFLINEIVLEIIAGIGMYLFIRILMKRLQNRIDNTIAITAGCLFATLGTFMMLPNACFNPIAFLPWCMFSVTLIFSGHRKIFDSQNITAMLILAVSIALSLNSGFPEIAFINMLLVLAYVIILFVKSEQRAIISRLLSLLISGTVALLASLPWLIEFLNYIKPANGLTGLHNTTILGGIGNTIAYPSSFIPNIIGYNSTNPVYGSIGGFFTVSCIIIALFALCNPNIRLGPKLLFGGWFLVGWLRIIGFSAVSVIISHIPMLGSAAVYRYIPASMSLSLIVLVCLGLNDISKNKKVDRRTFVLVTFFAILFYGFVLYSGRHYIKTFALTDAKQAIFALLFLQLSVFSCIAVLLAIFTNWKYKKYFICFVLILESLICFGVWQFGAYTKTAYADTRSVQFLQRNIKSQRFDSNLLNPNYGSYFNISEISMMDLPIPTLWGNYIAKNITSYIPSIGYLSNDFSSNRILQDERLGVKYMLVNPNTIDNNVIKQRQLKLVYSDQTSQIFELPVYSAYFSGSNCSIAKNYSFDTAAVNCSQPSKITRLELFYPGWHVKVDGESAKISSTDNLFQQINIPKGKHTLEYNYWPKYMTIALISVTVSGVIIIAGVVYVLVVTRKISKPNS